MLRNVVDLRDALRKSLTSTGKAAPANGKKPKKTATGQREMLMAIPGKGERKPRLMPRKRSARLVNARRDDVQVQVPGFNVCGLERVMTVGRGKSSDQKTRQTEGKRPLTSETAEDHGTAAAVGERQTMTDQVEGPSISNCNHVINR
jgi:hypothetical protein